MFSKKFGLSLILLVSLHSAFAFTNQNGDAGQLSGSATRIALALQDDAVLSLLSARIGSTLANVDRVSYTPGANDSGTVYIRSGKCTVQVEVIDQLSVQEGRDPINLPTVNEASARVSCTQ